MDDLGGTTGVGEQDIVDTAEAIGEAGEEGGDGVVADTTVEEAGEDITDEPPLGLSSCTR